MRKYYLANPEPRSSVDLRNYTDEIKAAVHEVMPNADVLVSKSWYSVSPTPEKGAAIKIGRTLSSKDILGTHCVHIPKLFNSISIEEKEESNDPCKEPHDGGHH